MQRSLPLARRQTVFVGVFLVVVVLFCTTHCMGVVRGLSMDPTYQDGQVVLVRRRNIFNQTLRRDDVVLVQRERGEVIIKRVYRLPGEKVPRGHPYLLTGTDMRGLRDYYEQETVKDGGQPSTRYFVPKGYIVVLGDNPEVSEDSRYFGPVPISSVIGTVVDAPPPPNTATEQRTPAAPPGA